MRDDKSMRPEHFFTEGTKEKFLIQDPFGLREVIQPVVSLSQVENSITGLGTCFQVSPWLWLTAHHVVQHSVASAFPEGEVGAVGFSMGLVYGTAGFISTDIFGEIVQCVTYKTTDATSNDYLPGPKPPEIVIDAAALRVNVENLKKAHLRSPLPISRVGPKIGDEVLAIGYPILGSKFEADSARSIFEERMFGASGVVTKVHTNGTSASKPWPTFEIEGDWEAGMSGGPVINTLGQVVGAVSSSFAPDESGPGIGFAVNLPMIPLGLIAPELDLLNPGFSIGFGVFDSGDLRGFFPALELAQQFAAGSENYVVQKISFNPKTEDWIEVV